MSRYPRTQGVLIAICVAAMSIALGCLLGFTARRWGFVVIPAGLGVMILAMLIAAIAADRKAQP